MRRSLPLICLPLCALALSACTKSVSTAAFKGEQHEVAQAISDLQSNATTGEEQKICEEQLAAAVVARLGGAKGCEKALKSQLTEVDSLEALVESVTVSPDGKTATAQVKSVHEGKKATSTLALVNEGGKWKISGLG